MRADKIKSYILQTWHHDDAAPICIKLIDFIIGQPTSKSRMLTYSSMANIVEVKSENESLLRAVSILSGRFDVLVMHFLLIDEEGNEFILDEDESQYFLTERKLAHPDTGKLIDNPDSFIYPFYEGNKSALTVNGDA